MMNEKRFKLDWKVFAYMLLWTVLIGVGKNVLFMGIETFPDIITYGLAGFFLIIGLILAIVESRMNTAFFYAWGKNWNGGGIGNSSMLCGSGVGFLPLNIGTLLVVSVLVAGFVTILKSVVPAKADDSVNMEKYPFE